MSRYIPPHPTSVEPPLDSMGSETNIDSIMALERDIERGTGDVIHLKRVRNSLLNISTRVPPEILGYIFRCNATPEDLYDGLPKGSYNFLLVCYRWFEVASNTPELWTYWGNTLELWSRRYQRSGAAPVDLALRAIQYPSGVKAILFDGPLRDAVRDRAAHDSIRSLHLQDYRNTELLSSIVSLPAPDGEGSLRSGIESLVLESIDLNASEFPARYHFPKLRVLRLLNAKISSWDELKLQAPSLTILSLDSATTSGRPTTSQLLAILASHPNLQGLSLSRTMIPRDVGDKSTFRVPLRRLEKLYFIGDYYYVFRLLDRLECPNKLDRVVLTLLECTTEGLPRSLGPYLQDRIRRDDRFQDSLGIHAASDPASVAFEITNVGELKIPTTRAGRDNPCLSFTARFNAALPQGAGEEICVDLIGLTPREHAIDFWWELNTLDMTNLLFTMPNTNDLYLPQSGSPSTLLQQDLLPRTKPFPSLRRLCLYYSYLQSGDDWSPLITYLTHQASDGQAISLTLGFEGVSIPPETVREIEHLVQDFNLGWGSWGVVALRF